MKIIKSIFVSLMMVAAGSAALTSCDGDPVLPPMVSPELGQGTWDAPFTVQGLVANFDGTNAIANQWVKGYIVGSIPSGETSISATVFGTANASTSNVVLANRADETNTDSCIVIQLSNVRDAVNLSAHPENLGQQISLYGSVEKYFGKAGLKSTSAYQWGDQGYYIEVYEVKGQGTADVPYTALDVAKGSLSGTAWVTGYIVGWVSGQTISDGATFDANATSQSNILLAETADVTDYTQCAVVQLPSGDVRSALNLQDNPTNLGKQVSIKGSLEAYFGVNGVKSVTDYAWGDKGVETPAVEAIYSNTFLESQGDFISHDVVGVDNQTIWKQSTSYGMVATAYFNSANYDSESWLVSPQFDLTSATGVSLKFDQAMNYFSDIDTGKTQATVWVKENGGSWTQLTDVTYPDSLGWSFVSSGSIDLSAYQGKVIQIGFKYVSTSAKAGTWEIKNFVLQGAGGSVGSNPGY
jgi:hypothetical protein